MKIELKNIKVFDELSQETTCFTADIFMDNMKIAFCKNNGDGGCTDIYRHPDSAVFHEFNVLIESRPDIIYPKCEYSDEFSVKSTVENWVDYEIYLHLEKKAIKKLNKDMLKGICYGSKKQYNILSWKGYSIAELLDIDKGRNLIQDTVNNLKLKGAKILNNNLIGIILD